MGGSDVLDPEIGKKYNRLTVVSFDHKTKYRYKVYKFLCDCGNYTVTQLSQVKNGYTKSCGCLAKELNSKRNKDDLTGKKFNYLTILYENGKDKHHNIIWHCRCDCGNEVDVIGQSLKSGNTTACGCRQIMGSIQSIKHGYSKTRLYQTWVSMKARCCNPNSTGYKDYGGRGIKVCDEWRNDFIPFYNWAITNGYQDSLTIDRIDNDGNYEPNNCCWATMKEQLQHNRRTVYFTCNGETHNLSEWSKITGLAPYIIRSRIKKYGWSVEDALTTPILARGCALSRYKC